jgi:hypothetical protein
MLHNSLASGTNLSLQTPTSPTPPFPSSSSHHQNESWISLQSIKDVIRMSTDCPSSLNHDPMQRRET